VRDMLDLPGSAGPRPSKKQKIAPPKSSLKGLAREVQSLGGDNPIAIVPEISLFKKKRVANRKPAARWTLKPFHNSAREDNLTLRHWRQKPEAPLPPAGESESTEPIDVKEEIPVEDSTFAKFNVKVSVPQYNDEQYEAKLKSDDWSREETDYLINLIEDYDLRWPVIWDRYEYSPSASSMPESESNNEEAIIPVPKVRSMEDMKARYYFVADQMLCLLKPQTSMVQAEMDLHDILSGFNPAKETERKQYAEAAFNRTAAEAREEESLLLELRRIMARTERLGEERKELFARLEAPHGTGNFGPYTSSQGLQQLLQQLMSVDKSKKRRSLVGIDAASPANGPGNFPQGGLDRRDSTLRESVSGPSNPNNKKGPPQGPSERRQLTEEEERVYGVSLPTEKLSGPYPRWERINKVLTTKSATIAAKYTNILTVLDIPPRLIMPTADVGVEYEKLIADVTALLELKKKEEKIDADLALARAYKAEKEKKERGEPSSEKDKSNADGDGQASIKMENDGREKSAAPSTHKRSVSVLSAVSDKSTKRQKK
jgi:DNA methyltransferase 1-associated protein 1